MSRLLLALAIGVAACGEPSAQAPDEAGPGGEAGAGSPRFTVSPQTLDFGSVFGTSSVIMSIAFTNAGDGASAPVTLSLGGANPTVFELAAVTCSGVLAPGATCSAMARFSPSTTGSMSATLELTDGAASAAAELTGTGATSSGILLSPSVHDFGAINLTTTSATTFTVSNPAAVATGALGVTVTGANAGDFAIGTTTCNGAVLPANSTCTVSIAFTPSSTGARAASVRVSGTPGGTAIASLVGTGLAATGLSISPAVHDFGDVQIGSSSLGFQFTVTNLGAATTGAITTAKSGTHVGDFLVMANNCGAPLASGAGCTLFVTFEPGAVGPRAAHLNLSATPGGTANADLSGTCTP
ncbi:MAG: choice-of-anchor D domain-containing protein [Myxococcales bacterium]|nr:choice-of-anchor D domain-containing protein [Myxococcales bacterium]